MSDIVEHLAASIHPIRLDPEDNDASVARWFVEAAIDEIQSLRQQLADTQQKLEAAEKVLRQVKAAVDNGVGGMIKDSLLSAQINRAIEQSKGVDDGN